MGEIEWDDDEIEWDEPTEPATSAGPLEANIQATKFFLGGLGHGRAQASATSPSNATATRQGVASVLGFGQGITGGHLDEAVGAVRSVPELFGDRPLSEVYRGKRDEEREMHARARKDSPVSYGAGEVAGGITASGTKVKSLVGAVKSGAGFGTAVGSGASEADLTRGEFGKYGKEVAGGAMAGGLTGGALYGLTGLPLRLLGKRAQRAVVDIEQEQGNAINSAQGRYAEKWKDAQAGLDRLIASPERQAAIGAAHAPPPGQTVNLRGQPPPPANPALAPVPTAVMRDLAQRREKGALKDVLNIHKLQKPDPIAISAEVERMQTAGANRHMLYGAGKAAVGLIGGKLGGPIAGAAVAIGTVPFGIRHLFRGAMEHPSLVRRLSGLQRWGPVIGNAAAKGQTTLLPVLETLYRQEPEVRDEVDRIAAEESEQ